MFFGLIVKRIGLKQLGVPKNYKFPIQQRRTFSLTFLRMSDSEEDPSVPDALTAQKLCKEFEAVTNTDEIMAQMYLQVSDELVQYTTVKPMFGMTLVILARGSWVTLG